MNKCEAEFEKWYAPYRVSNRTFERNDDGTYKYEETSVFYEVFCAGWTSHSKTIQEKI